MESKQESLPLKLSPFSARLRHSLRDEQEDGVRAMLRALSLKRTALCVMVTGGGKTEVFISLIERMNVKTLVLMKGVQLVEQTARRIGGDVGVYCSDLQRWEKNSQTIVASINSLRTPIEGVELIVTDEAHDVGEGIWSETLSHYPTAKIAGFTATPWRNNTPIYGPGKLFERIDFERSFDFSLAKGRIVRPVLKCGRDAFSTAGLREAMGDWNQADIDLLAKDENKIRRQCVDALARTEDRKKIVWVASSIEHAEKIQKILSNAGHDSCIMHSKKTSEQNKVEKRSFELGHYRHMVSIAMLSQGYDYPAIDAVVLMRPIKSIKLYIQIVGRGLRLSPGKTDALVLDYGECVKHCGPINAPYIQTTEKKKKGKAPLILEAFWTCYGCMSFVAIDRTECECGELRPARPKPSTGTLSPYEGDILQEKNRVYNINRIVIKQHVSKNTGNRCIRIDYYTGITAISSYFTNHPISWVKCSVALEHLGISTDSFDSAWAQLEEPLELEGDWEVEAKREGKWERILSCSSL